LKKRKKALWNAGKFADFVILDQDLMKVESTEVLQTRVMATYSGGEKVFERK
jgi:predicted amidohydrolase YtcJ